MTDCAVHDCNEPADGVLVHHGVALAPICEVHALALGCDVFDPSAYDVERNGPPPAQTYNLVPAHADGWVLTLELGAPGPVLYEGESPAVARVRSVLDELAREHEKLVRDEYEGTSFLDEKLDVVVRARSALPEVETP